jgi:hypothetical protein
MKLYVTVTSERATKGQGGNEQINIDLYAENRAMLARLVFRKDETADDTYVLTEDFVFRSDRLRIHAFPDKVDAPLEDKTTSIPCLWCGKPATHKDWREIDEMTTSTRECDRCATLDTQFLLDRTAKRKGKKQKGEEGHTYYCRACKYTTFWTLTDYAERGTPVCNDCGDDMELTPE